MADRALLAGSRSRWSGRPCAGAAPPTSTPTGGDEPLEDAFTGWHWSRAALRRGAAILYEASRRDGGRRPDRGALRPLGRASRTSPRRPASPCRARSGACPRGTRADDGRASVVRTLEDAPFYARSVLATRLLGEPVAAVHESLSLDRFRAPWVQAMLPFRMPRALR